MKCITLLGRIRTLCIISISNKTLLKRSGNISDRLRPVRTGTTCRVVHAGATPLQTDATRPSVTPSHRPRPAGQRRSALTCSLTPAGALRKNRVPMPMKKCSPFPPQSTPIHRSVQTYRSSKIVLPRAKRTQPLYYDSAGYM